jgi:conjugative relaxase-like TrwC/TraI family protein
MKWRIFFDITFSLPKSVSIAALVGNGLRIVEAHHRGVGVGVTLLQREGLETKGVGGASTVNMEHRNGQYIDGAQRAIQSEANSRMSTESSVSA